MELTWSWAVFLSVLSVCISVILAMIISIYIDELSRKHEKEIILLKRENKE